MKNIPLKSYKRKAIRKIAKEDETIDEARTPLDVSQILTKKMSETWFFLRELIDALDITRDIGIVIMSFYSAYRCGECHTPVSIQKLPLTSLCVTCYNLGNTCCGVLCHYCGPYMLDECMSCRYTQCRAHSIFGNGSTHCHVCDTFICKNCVIPSIVASDGDPIRLCGECMFKNM